MQNSVNIYLLRWKLILKRTHLLSQVSINKHHVDRSFNFICCPLPYLHFYPRWIKNLRREKKKKTETKKLFSGNVASFRHHHGYTGILPAAHLRTSVLCKHPRGFREGWRWMGSGGGGAGIEILAAVAPVNAMRWPYSTLNTLSFLIQDTILARGQVDHYVSVHRQIWY